MDSMQIITENLFLDSTWNEPGMRMDSMHSGAKISFLGHFTWNPCGIHMDSMEFAWIPQGSVGEGKVLKKYVKMSTNYTIAIHGHFYIKLTDNTIIFTPKICKNVR